MSETKSSPTTLPACPACGGAAEIESGESQYDETMKRQIYYAAVFCENRITCGLGLTVFLSNLNAAQALAVKRWSRRTASDAATLITKLLAAHPHVGRTPGIFGGKLIVGGIRIAVTDILVYLWQGNSIEHICKTYGLTEDQVKCAIAFAQDFIEESDNRGTPAASPSDAAEIVAEMARESEAFGAGSTDAQTVACCRAESKVLREAVRRIRAKKD